MKTLKIEVISSAEALVFWQQSPHGTVFTHPEILELLAHKVDWWLVSKGEKPMCLWPICTNPSGEVYLPTFSYWVGPMLSAQAVQTPLHRRFAYDLSVFELLLSTLVPNYHKLKASLHPGIDDIRAFDWWNYHSPELGRFCISPRYSAVLVGLQERSLENIASAYREVRRQELRKAGRREDLIVTDHCLSAELIEGYSAMMNSKHGTTGRREVKEIQSMLHCTKKGFGFVIALRDQEMKAVQIALVLFAKGIANLALNWVAESHRNQAVAVYGVTMAIAEAKRRGCEIFDFNGANSPQRGDDKHSYGSQKQLYFEIAN